MSIIIKKINKSYGRKTVLSEISINIDGGQCYCLLGKNGAGKSTLVNILADIIKPDTGQLKILDMTYDDSDITIKKITGVFPESKILIPEFSGLQYLNFVGNLHSLPSSVVSERIKSLINFFFDDINELKAVISTYSKGMKVKLGICASLLHNPQILILDEPFNGLDPISAQSLISFLKSFLNPSRVIFICSHSLFYIEKIATHIGVLDDSKLTFSSTVHDFTLNGQSAIEAELFKILRSTPKNKGELSWVL